MLANVKTISVKSNKTSIADILTKALTVKISCDIIKATQNLSQAQLKEVDCYEDLGEEVYETWCDYKPSDKALIKITDPVSLSKVTKMIEDIRSSLVQCIIDCRNTNSVEDGIILGCILEKFLITKKKDENKV